MSDRGGAGDLWATMPSLRAAGRFVDTGFQMSPIGMALIDDQGRHIATNPALSTVLGHPPEAVATMSCFDVVHPDDVPADRAGMASVLAGERASYVREQRVIAADGRHLWVESTVSGGARGGSSVRLLRQVRSIQDIADQRAADRRLRAAHEELELRAQELADANDRLASFAATLTHDLLQPVAALDGFLRLLDAEAQELNEEHRDWLQRAIRSKERLAESIRSLHRHAAAADLDLVPVSFGEIAERFAADVHATHPTAAVDVGELPVVLGDPGFLEQVVANLVQNALKYHSPERSLRVGFAAERVGRCWDITVTDNGLGIAPDQLAAVFQRGFRGTSSAGTRGSGTGLATVQALVERMGGTVRADPWEPGARIRLTLRAADA